MHLVTTNEPLYLARSLYLRVQRDGEVCISSFKKIKNCTLLYKICASGSVMFPF